MVQGETGHKGLCNQKAMRHVPKSESMKPALCDTENAAPEAGSKSPTTGRAGLPATRERELVRRAQAGDLDAYEELIRAYQQRVFAIVGGVLRQREDIQDVAQQVLLKIFLALKRFDLRSTFSTWLYKVAVNECFDYLRKKKVRPLVYEADMSEEQVQQLTATHQERPGTPREDSSRRAELRQLVDWLLNELPEEERLMLVLKEVEGLTVEEIGEALGLNVNTVKVRMFRARGRLMEIYRRRMASRKQASRRERN